MNDSGGIERRLVSALRAMVAGDAIGAAGEGYRPAEIEEVYDGPITELIDPVNLYPEQEADRLRGRVGPVGESALAFARAMTAEGASAVATGPGWPITLGLVTPPAAVGEAVAAVRRHGGGAADAAMVAALAAATGGYLARDAIALAAEAATAARERPLARLILEAAGAAQGSGGRVVGPAVAEVASPRGDHVAAVAFALAVAFGALSVRRAVIAAANEGGAASLTAAIAGALCGALAPGSNVEAWSDDVERVSGLDLARLAQSLLRVRAERCEGRG